MIRYCMFMSFAMLFNAVAEAQGPLCNHPLQWATSTVGIEYSEGEIDPITIDIPLSHENNDGTTYGAGHVYWLYSGSYCGTPRTNCSGHSYTYATFNVSHSWTKTQMGQTFTVADTLAYWQWYYAGYTQVGGVDYTQNCHGYAFGVGAHVDDGAYGVDVLLNPTMCYSSGYVHTANIALMMNHGGVAGAGAFLGEAPVRS